MTALEKKLQAEVLKNCELAEKQCGCQMTRFIQTIDAIWNCENSTRKF